MLPPEQKLQVRIMLAEDMIKKQFVVKTIDTLNEFNNDSGLELFEKGAQASEVYKVFESWMNKFVDEEPMVQMTKELTNQCALHIIDPENKEAPELDYSSAIPANLNPAKLNAIYAKIWSLQTEAGLQMK